MRGSPTSSVPDVAIDYKAESAGRRCASTHRRNRRLLRQRRWRDRRRPCSASPWCTSRVAVGHFRLQRHRADAVGPQNYLSLLINRVDDGLHRLRFRCPLRRSGSGVGRGGRRQAGYSASTRTGVSTSSLYARLFEGSNTENWWRWWSAGEDGPSGPPSSFHAHPGRRVLPQTSGRWPGRAPRTSSRRRTPRTVTTAKCPTTWNPVEPWWIAVLAGKRRRRHATGTHRVAWLDFYDSGMTGWEQNLTPRSLHNAELTLPPTDWWPSDEEDADIVTGYDWHGGYGHPDQGSRSTRCSIAPQDRSCGGHVLEVTMNRDAMRLHARLRPPPPRHRGELRPDGPPTTVIRSAWKRDPQQGRFGVSPNVARAMQAREPGHRYRHVHGNVRGVLGDVSATGAPRARPPWNAQRLVPRRLMAYTSSSAGSPLRPDTDSGPAPATTFRGAWRWSNYAPAHLAARQGHVPGRRER